MSSVELNSFRDAFRRENVELYLRLCSDVRLSLERYTSKRVIIPHDLDCVETLEKRALAAESTFDGVFNVLHQELATLVDVHNRFFESFGKSIKVDLIETSLLELKNELKRNEAQLSEEECKRALAIAVRVIEYSGLLRLIIQDQATIIESLAYTRRKQISKWDEKASELAQELDRLRVEVEAREQQVKKMSAGVRSCSKRLNGLASISQTVAKGKARAQVAALEDIVTAVEELSKAESEKVKQLKSQLGDAEKELEATRTSLRDSAAENETLRNHLRMATQNGHTHSARVEKLEEKLRCSICMDRPKNVAFACGHTCCDQCASDWKRCPNKCKGTKSQKPVKHTFRLYM